MIRVICVRIYTLIRMKNIVITGGAGFIGSHVVRLFVNKYPEYHIINLDKLTYAGNLANLKDIEDKPNYTFVKGDICDFDLMLKLMQDYMGLDNRFRMNKPSTVGMNWKWRIKKRDLTKKLQKEIYDVTLRYGRKNWD